MLTVSDSNEAVDDADAIPSVRREAGERERAVRRRSVGCHLPSWARNALVWITERVAKLSGQSQSSMKLDRDSWEKPDGRSLYGPKIFTGGVPIVPVIR